MFQAILITEDILNSSHRRRNNVVNMYFLKQKIFIIAIFLYYVLFQIGVYSFCVFNDAIFSYSKKFKYRLNISASVIFRAFRWENFNRKSVLPASWGFPSAEQVPGRYRAGMYLVTPTQSPLPMECVRYDGVLQSLKYAADYFLKNLRTRVHFFCVVLRGFWYEKYRFTGYIMVGYVVKGILMIFTNDSL